MKIEAETPADYISQLPPGRKKAVSKLRTVVRKNLPKGFREEINYSMLGYVVPHSLYPAGYHCDPSKPLPFINIASQKNFIALYHMGIYADETLYKWLTAEYPKHVDTKLDMGKSCIRFKNPDKIPFELIAELVSKITPDEWISFYEKSTVRSTKRPNKRSTKP